MKKWMIWSGAAGAGLAGVALAFFVITNTMTPIENLGPSPEIQTPRGVDAPSPTISKAPGTPATLTTESTAQPANRGGESNTTSSNADPPQNEPYLSPARLRQAAIRELPEVKAMAASSVKWQVLLRTTAKMPKDPVASHTFNRVVELDRDIGIYRRDPTAFDYDELVRRQRHMISELKQTSYWGPELQQIEADMETTFAEGAPDQD